MRRRSIVAVLCIGLALMGAIAQAQTKSSPAPIKAPALKPLDINTATEEEITAVGIDKLVARKIVENRPYRNKTELVSRMLLTRDQYDKVKNAIVAKQPPKGTSK